MSGEEIFEDILGQLNALPSPKNFYEKQAIFNGILILEAYYRALDPQIPVIIDDPSIFHNELMKIPGMDTQVASAIIKCKLNITTKKQLAGCDFDTLWEGIFPYLKIDPKNLAEIQLMVSQALIAAQSVPDIDWNQIPPWILKTGPWILKTGPWILKTGPWILKTGP